MEDTIIIIIFICIIIFLASFIAVGVVAGSKGRDISTWFILAIILTPFFALLVLIALGDTDEKRTEKLLKDEETKRLAIKN